MDFTKYENKMPYPDLPRRPRPLLRKHTIEDLEKYADEFRKFVAQETKRDDLMKCYRAEERRLFDLFKTDALEEVGLSDHPKGFKAFDMAWSEGHSYGWAEVFYILERLASLIL